MLRAIPLHQHRGPELPHRTEQRQILRIDRWVGRAGIVPDDGRGEQVVMTDDPDDVVVPGQEPELITLVSVDRVLFPQPGVPGMRVGDDLWGEEVIKTGAGGGGGVRHRCGREP